MNVVYVEANKSVNNIDIPNTLESLQYFIGGYIEVIPVQDDIVAIVDEEGRLKDRPITISVRGEPIAGPVIFCKTSGEEFTDLNYHEASLLMALLGERKW